MEIATREVFDNLFDYAESVCRNYLPAGRRDGKYWIVGDIDNAPGGSLFVGLHTGKWLDGKTGEHGDLLDIIRHRSGARSFVAALDEARRFLALTPQPQSAAPQVQEPSSVRAKRLYALCTSITATLGADYLRGRQIACDLGRALRFHPHCLVRPNGLTQSWPAIVAAVTDPAGTVVAVQRVFLDQQKPEKAPFYKPKRALGDVAAGAIRFGNPDEILLAGEGLENVLSARTIFANLPCVATTSAAHLGSFVIPTGIRRLYIADDGDPAAAHAIRRLRCQAAPRNIDVIPLRSPTGDLNDGLCTLGRDTLRRTLRPLLDRADLDRLLP